MRHLVLFSMSAVLAAEKAAAADLRVGMIGLDTSHVTAFTQLLNDPDNPKHVPGARVVAAFKGGSADIASSASRGDGYTKELPEKWGVNISDTIEEMAKAKPWYAVIRDSSMADDATHANYEELFRTYSPDTVPQVI